MEKKKKRVLVIGDWVLDHYWVLSPIQSDISSHTGRAHFRIVSKPENLVLDLCGAGLVARVLYYLGTKSTEGYEVWGLGRWNEKDNQLMKHLLHDCQIKHRPESLTLNPCDTEPEDAHLYTLYPQESTIQVVRQYLASDLGVELIQRIDDESPMTGKVDEEQDIDIKLKDKLPETFDLIVVYDLCKGVVGGPLIEWLSKKYRTASWYVLTKDRNPAWIKVLKGSLRLQLVGAERLAMENPSGVWLVNGNLTRAAVKAIQARDGDSVAVVVKEGLVIANLNHGKECVACQSYAIAPEIDRVGWSSALFASLVDASLNDKEIRKNEIKEAISSADEFCRRWSTQKHGRAQPSVTSAVAESAPKSWISVTKEWEDAFIGQGIMGDTPSQRRIEVWRGSTDLPGYMACIEERRAAVREMCSRIGAFASAFQHTRPMSIRIEASPGSGKSSLARSLARAFDLAYREFDISQMTSRDDIIDMFDMIEAKQAEVGERLLVFVDELNAKLEAGYVYGMFLSPLEAGHYMRRKTRVSLRPCVWVFADSESSKENNGTKTKFETEKIEDFRSRVTLNKVMTYEAFAELAGSARAVPIMHEAKLEQVYIAISMLKQYHPEVGIVSQEVLRYFYQMFSPQKNPLRDIRNQVSQLRNVRFGKIERQNWLEQKEWEKLKPEHGDRDDISIVLEPPSGW